MIRIGYVPGAFDLCHIERLTSSALRRTLRNIDITANRVITAGQQLELAHTA